MSKEEKSALWDNSYARLPEKFFAKVMPTRVTKPYSVAFNNPLAEQLGFDRITDAADIFSGNKIRQGTSPLAMAYAGHQFGNFVPSLGDGRAILLGEVIDVKGARHDIHLKGSGRTPFSRQGDGRSPLGPAIREYIVSEAMHALHIPTTRSLAVVGTGEFVCRETDLPGGILTRVAQSHIRIGTFQYFAARKDADAVRTLADYAIARLYPDLKDTANPYLSFLEMVIEKQARLIAQWMGVGFIHGVMNTDNMTVSGETIDYGPCAFMDEYDPARVFSSIDVYGRYAFGNQPSIAQWNLTRLAECLVPLLDADQETAIRKAQSAVESFKGLYERLSLATFSEKLGIGPDADAESLIGDLFDLMTDQKADFTLTFRALAVDGDTEDAALIEAVLGNASAFSDWHTRWKKKRRQSSGKTLTSVNPLYIPRNHLVEEAIRQAYKGDFFTIDTLVRVLADPCTEQEGAERYALPPRADERVEKTFCGT